jgi:transcriptional regulator with XRE-family HTH domain
VIEKRCTGVPDFNERKRRRFMTISDRIFEKLEQKKMSQKEFSEATGIAQSTISEWKKKKINPSADKIMIICSTLEVTPEWLLSGVERSGTRGRKTSLYVVEKNSEIGKLIANYNLLREKYRYQIKGYMDALKKMAD